MTKILFVCHGNICRSPMAEFIMKDLVKKAGRSEDYYIESAATSDDETGNPVYPPARRKLEALSIDCSKKRARRLVPSDYEKFDYIIGMDEENRRNMKRLFLGDPKNKVSLLLDFTLPPRQVADPWYTGDFDATLKDVLEGCKHLLKTT
ncbi:MAG: low molecular weight protein-tyrosine-phosphatase [Clostridia bacterium]|nr:low molecular weight protein-tyrosine-phosphatase [Clostridia bacterium]